MAEATPVELQFLSFPPAPETTPSGMEMLGTGSLPTRTYQEERHNLLLPDLPFSKQTTTNKDNVTPPGLQCNQLNNKTIKPPSWRAGCGSSSGSQWAGWGWVGPLSAQMRTHEPSQVRTVHQTPILLRTKLGLSECEHRM